MINDFKHSANNKEGHNSSHLLSMDDDVATPRTVSAHILVSLAAIYARLFCYECLTSHPKALFSRSTDDRLAPGDRSHSLKHLKTAFQLLDKVMKTPSLADDYDELLKRKKALEEEQRKKLEEKNRKESQAEELRRLELDRRKAQEEESRQLKVNRTEKVSVQDTARSATHPDLGQAVVSQERHTNVEETARVAAAADPTNDAEKKSRKRNGDDFAHSDVTDTNRTAKKNKIDGEADSPKREKPQPPPKPFTVMRTVIFLDDYSNPALQVSCKSGAIHPRSVCTLRYDSGYSTSGAGTVMDDETSTELQARLHRWDPYWKIRKEVGRATNFDCKGNPVMHSWKTASCFETSGYVRKEGNPLSCVEMVVDLSKEEDLGVDWHASGTAGRRKTGDRRLLLRSLPLVREPKELKKKCDTHIWPKGERYS